MGQWIKYYLFKCGIPLSPISLLISCCFLLALTYITFDYSGFVKYINNNSFFIVIILFFFLSSGQFLLLFLKIKSQYFINRQAIQSTFTLLIIINLIQYIATLCYLFFTKPENYEFFIISFEPRVYSFTLAVLNNCLISSNIFVLLSFLHVNEINFSSFHVNRKQFINELNSLRCTHDITKGTRSEVKTKCVESILERISSMIENLGMNILKIDIEKEKKILESIMNACKDIELFLTYYKSENDIVIWTEFNQFVKKEKKYNPELNKAIEALHLIEEVK